MQLAIRRLAEAALGAGAVALLVTLVVPWKERPLPRPAAQDPSVMVSAPAASAVTPQAGSPDSILPLLVGRTVTATRTPAPSANPPVDAPWLLYVGRSRTPDGSITVFLKDSRTGKVISAGKDQGVNAWIIVEEKDKSLLVKNAGTLYAVKKR